MTQQILRGAIVHNTRIKYWNRYIQELSEYDFLNVGAREVSQVADGRGGRKTRCMGSSVFNTVNFTSFF